MLGTEEELDRKRLCLKGEVLFVGGLEGGLKEFSVDRGAMVRDWGRVQAEGVLAAAVSPDRKFLFVGGNSGSLKQFSLASNKLIKCYKFFQIKGAITSMEFTRDNRYLITASNLPFKGGGSIYQWFNPSTLPPPPPSLAPTSPTSYIFSHLYQSSHSTTINSIAIHPDSTHLFTAGGDLEIAELKQWHLPQKTLIRDFSPTEMQGLITPRAISSLPNPDI